MKILVTGGCGFIGSNFIRYWRSLYGDEILNLDNLTYAGDPNAFPENMSYYHWTKESINNPDVVKDIMNDFKPEVIYHFAAESHVDNSIKDSSEFLKTNILGTVNLLEGVRKYNPYALFVHVSTDEVFGSLKLDDEPFNENTPYNPRSPYAASKAASDHFVQAYHETYGLRTIITNCSNNYGPYQHPEKFIPTVIVKALTGQKIPVYGNGMNIRDWLYVKDHCIALDRISAAGKVGESYCIGGGTQKTNIELAKDILNILGLPLSQIEMVEDRKGHDFRYDIDCTKLKEHCWWMPVHSMDRMLVDTVNWYRNNMDWVYKCLKR
jgi:dTDP-glucose 4,6-dehydratase